MTGNISQNSKCFMINQLWFAATVFILLCFATTIIITEPGEKLSVKTESREKDLTQSIWNETQNLIPNVNISSVTGMTI